MSSILLQTSPYLIRKRGNFTGNDQYEGYCADLIKKVADHLNIEYKIVPVADARYGSVDERGKWNGMVGELIRGVGLIHRVEWHG